MGTLKAAAPIHVRAYLVIGTHVELLLSSRNLEGLARGDVPAHWVEGSLGALLTKKEQISGCCT